MEPQLATHRSIRDAIAAAKRGEPTSLEASAKMSVADALQFANQLVFEDSEASGSVRIATKGPWLLVIPVDEKTKIY